MTSIAIETLPGYPEVPLAAAVSVTTGGHTFPMFYEAIQVTCWGIGADGVPYWTDGSVPDDEQAVLSFADGHYVLTRQR